MKGIEERRGRRDGGGRVEMETEVDKVCKERKEAEATR